MIEIGDRPRFAQVRLGIDRLGDGPPMRHLDRHVPIELLVMGAIHDAETALSEDRLHLIAADALGMLGTGAIDRGAVRRGRFGRRVRAGEIAGGLRGSLMGRVRARGRADPRAEVVRQDAIILSQGTPKCRRRTSPRKNELTRAQLPASHISPPVGGRRVRAVSWP